MIPVDIPDDRAYRKILYFIRINTSDGTRPRKLAECYYFLSAVMHRFKNGN